MIYGSLVQNGPAEDLNQTDKTQPALSDIRCSALWRLMAAAWAEQRLAVVAGHSLGEYTALVCAGAIRL